MSEKLVAHMLQRLEHLPHAVFGHSDLAAVDARGISIALEKGYLRRSEQPPRSGDSYPCPTPSATGCIRRLSFEGESFFACCECDANEPAIRVMPSDLEAYSPQLTQILGKVAAANKLASEIEQRSPRLWLLGSSGTRGMVRDWFCALLDRMDEAESMLLRNDLLLSKGAVGVVVLAPTFGPSTDLQGRLRRINVTVEAIGAHPFKAIDRTQIADGLQPAPRLSAVQHKDAREHGYRVDLRIHISGRKGPKSGYLVAVGPQVATVARSQFLLFLRLVVELKQLEGGWISVEQLRDERYVSTEGDGNQERQRLPKEFKGFVDDPAKLIEHRIPGDLRLAAHPALVTYDLDQLRKGADQRVRALLKQLPASAEIQQRSSRFK